MSVSSSVQAITQSDSASGWYGFMLALLNVVQTVVLAWLAGARRREYSSRYEPSPSRPTPSDGRESARSSAND